MLSRELEWKGQIALKAENREYKRQTRKRRMRMCREEPEYVQGGA